MKEILTTLLGAAIIFVLVYILFVTRRELRYNRLAASMKNKEAYRGSQAIGGRTDGPAASSLDGATLEGFTDVQGKNEVTPDSGPAPAALNPRNPYHLLTGVLKNAPVDNQDNNKLNSCACYGIDYENRIQRTGNFVQRTNNYQRLNPDSCSAPFHELVNNFYEKMTLQV
jgi:hypothetical protein